MAGARDVRDRRTVRVLISGRVQGVGFRYWMADAASDLGLGGWVANRGDGSVEALVSGERDLVDDLLQRVETGPRYANVERVDVIDERCDVPQDFRIVRLG